MQYTENLNLAKYDANDVTSYLEVSNANLTKIDAGHGTLNAQVTANTSAIGELQDDVDGMAPQVADAGTKANAGLSNMASVYDATQTYAVGDYCLYNNNLYRCITPIPTAESFDGTKWERINITNVIKALKGEVNDIDGKLSEIETITNFINTSNKPNTLTVSISVHRYGRVIHGRIACNSSVTVGGAGAIIGTLNSNFAPFDEGRPIFPNVNQNQATADSAIYFDSVTNGVKVYNLTADTPYVCEFTYFS